MDTRAVPGPHRAPGAPKGREAVTRAILDAAAQLFADKGVDATTRRDIAEAADVSPTLVNRYIGNHDDVVAAVLDDLARQLAESVSLGFAPPSFDRDSPAIRWARILSQVVARKDADIHLTTWNPVLAAADVIGEAGGLDERTARVRATTVTALAFGWRLLEPLLIEAAGIEDIPLAQVRGWLWQATQAIATLPLDAPPWEEPGDT